MCDLCEPPNHDTYNEGILALDGDVSDLAVLAEDLIKVLSSCTSAEPAHVDLGVPV